MRHIPVVLSMPYLTARIPLRGHIQAILVGIVVIITVRDTTTLVPTRIVADIPLIAVVVSMTATDILTAEAIL